MPAASPITLLMISRLFAKIIWQEEVAILFWSATYAPGNRRHQAQHSHRQTATTSSSRSSSRWRFVPFHVFDQATAFHERSGRRWQPQTAAALMKAADVFGMPVVATTSPFPQKCLDIAGAPLLLRGRKVIRRAATSSWQVTLLSHPPFINSKSPAMTCVNTTISTGRGPKCVWTLAPIQKTNTPPSPFQLSSCNAETCHCDRNASPPNSGLIFPTDEMTNDKNLVDTGATLSIVPHNYNSKPSGPLLRGANGLPMPSWGFITKAGRFQSKLFTTNFFASWSGRIHSGYSFFAKNQTHCCPETNEVLLSCTAAPQPLLLPLCVSFLSTQPGQLPTCHLSPCRWREIWSIPILTS